MGPFRWVWILGVLFLLLKRHLPGDWVRYARIHGIQSDELQWIRYLDKPRVPMRNRTVVTMTTTPSRIDACFRSLYSILDQTHRVDEIILNIPHVSRKGVAYVIPEWLRLLARRNQSITIHRCADLGPITKLAPTLERYRNETVSVIVVDDDVIYKERHVYRLCELSRDFPNHAISGTGYRSFRKDGREKEYRNYGPGLKQVDVLMGVSGFLVTTRMFRYEEFMKGREKRPEYFFVDDNYVSMYLTSRRIPIIAMKYAEGLSCPEFSNFIKMVFNRDSDSLCRTANRPCADGWFGENERLIMDDQGMYLTQWGYFQFYFF
jgi:hypothetical protein